MSENNKLQKKLPDALKEKTQYALAFGVIATMLFVAGFPLFVISFFGIFAYFLWKTFTQPSPTNVREVFEFYLSANEVLRDDERRWFGFEMNEVIERGERILQTMNGAPPLVYFTLGALYHRAGNHKSAVNHLAYVLENEHADESTYAYATPELKNYVRVLRKIEREPAEAPQTSAAIRALERARRSRGKAILEESRKAVEESSRRKRVASAEQKKQKAAVAAKREAAGFLSVASAAPEGETAAEKQPVKKQEISQVSAIIAQQNGAREHANGDHGKNVREPNQNAAPPPRKPISEVLRDLYDDK